MYQTKVTEIGALVPDFKEELLMVLFGPSAMQELRDICVIHESEQEPKEVLMLGGKITFGDQEYTITKVGGEANANFESLGHISIYFREGENEVLPGAIIASPQVFPDITEGDAITFQ
ncbi:MAG: PTS glucitol/sorbitol transporter subunit IIA [Enterococcus devriesei]|uniref:PTS glucitol/sorbitol transporter subunit IIA n=1 Tax=Enterococcus devriesei TaxID=319970 RepID=UPI003F92AC2E